MPFTKPSHLNTLKGLEKKRSLCFFYWILLVPFLEMEFYWILFKYWNISITFINGYFKFEKLFNIFFFKKMTIFIH